MTSLPCHHTLQAAPSPPCKLLVTSLSPTSATLVHQPYTTSLLSIAPFQPPLNFLVKNIRVNSFTMKMEILLEPASNKLMVERFYTSAGNPVKEILLKLNLPDHRILKDGGEDFRYSDTERLSRSDEVLKVKNFKKDATLKLSKSTNQEWYEHVGPDVTRSQDDKVTRWQNEIMLG
ncbi:hypothetical protein Tco_0046863 [Tanacetum coccineum]